ncbi:MAG TPA: phosphoribosylamine--glycine ligase [Gemmatimonadales bacterium]|jgi:phosphoribosylamine--glycine ligase|nr:phosphoribosylamine--glycine ligase [Gemmatimonadales bacterium]
MKVLVVGGGGREHALCWSLRRDLPADDLYCAPGNPGTAELGTNLPIGPEDADRLIEAAATYAIELIIIGPEAPLAKGLADQLRSAGRLVFGPSAAAARIEASKAFAKEVMSAAGIPTAASGTFADLHAALAYVDRHAEPLVVKASGLAAGKGAIVCATREEAKRALIAMLGDGVFGEAGKVVVVEAFLEGEELSVLAITNGHELAMLPAAQDHKRLLDRDHGPNTGGMGAYSPVSLATPELLERVKAEVLQPAVTELARRYTPFTGVLYAGLMIDGDTPTVIEFNCRLGDPESQVILPRVSSGLLAALHASALAAPLPRLEISADSAVTTVLAAAGYPGEPRRGDAIRIPDNLPPSAVVFHAGTQRDETGVLRTNGGRVLAVTAVAPSFRAAQQTSRAVAAAIEFEGKQFRTDIGWREASRIGLRA